MARLPRIVVPNQPIHIMHRGNNRQDIFESETDMTRIIEDIAHALSKYHCSLHAYVIQLRPIGLETVPITRGQAIGIMRYRNQAG